MPGRRLSRQPGSLSIGRAGAWPDSSFLHPGQPTTKRNARHHSKTDNRLIDLFRINF